MISLPARAIEVNFLDESRAPGAKKLTLRTDFALVRMEITNKAFWINHQLSALSSISKLFGSKKTFLDQKNLFNQPDESISPTHRKIKTSFRFRGTRYRLVAGRWRKTNVFIATAVY